MVDLSACVSKRSVTAGYQVLRGDLVSGKTKPFSRMRRRARGPKGYAYAATPGPKRPLRVRPLLMTVLSNIFGLLPVLLDTGVGADVAKRIAAPMWGGLVSLTALTLRVIPAVYVSWRSRHLRGAPAEEVTAR